VVQSQPGQIVHETLSQKKKKNHKKELVEWLKVKAQSSNPRTAQKENTQQYLANTLNHKKKR
jgi:hypothetical protein